MSDIEQAIAAAKDGNASEFQSHIQSALMDRLGDAIDARKTQVAASYLQPEEEPEEIEVEVDEPEAEEIESDV